MAEQRKRKLDTGKTSNWDKRGADDGESAPKKFNPYLSGGGADDSYYGPSGGGGGATPAEMRKKDPNTNPLTGRPFSNKYHGILATRSKLPVYQFLDEVRPPILS